MDRDTAAKAAIDGPGPTKIAHDGCTPTEYWIWGDGCFVFYRCGTRIKPCALPGGCKWHILRDPDPKPQLVRVPVLSAQATDVSIDTTMLTGASAIWSLNGFLQRHREWQFRGFGFDHTWVQHRFNIPQPHIWLRRADLRWFHADCVWLEKVTQ